MERGKDGHLPASQPNGHAPSHQLLVNHEKRKPLFANASNDATWGPDIRDAGLEVRSATASVGPDARSGGIGARALNLARRTKSDPQGAASELGGAQRGVPVTSNAAFRSPGESRVLCSGTRGLQNRRPLSLTEAFKLAQEEEEEAERQRQLGGSPSPAPRPWRARPGQPYDEIQARQMLAEDHLDSKTRTRQSNAATRQKEQSSPGAGSGAQEAGTGAGTGAGPPKRFGAGSSLQERINEWRTKSGPVSGPARAGASPENLAFSSGEGRLPALVPGIDDVPFPSVESPQRKLPTSSPGKDFTWQVDQDFTAGDLQISDSPRIRVGNNSNRPFANRPSIFNDISLRSPARVKSPERSNSRINDIQADEIKHGVDSTAGNAGLKNLTKLRQERQNIRVDEIRATEVAVDKSIPIPDRNQPRQKNEKLDTIRQLETAGLSKRALAAIRLAEIKEQNAMARTTSPENATSPTGGTDRGIGMPARPKSAFEEGHRVPDSPATIFKRYGNEQENIKPAPGRVSGSGDTDVRPDTINERDLLRRLARAANASPVPEPATKRAPLAEPPKKDPVNRSTTARPSLAGRFTDIGRKSALTLNSKSDPNPSSSSSSSSNNKNNNNTTTTTTTNSSNSRQQKDNQLAKPTVGFAGLRRANSAESVKSKRSSMHSESDPTARIEAEMSLFAPAENHSERGSVRAPSLRSDSGEEESEPGGEEDLAEATPKPQKHDFTSLPTPKVTGAYVETPVTAKPDKIKDEAEEESVKPFREKLKEQKERDQELRGRGEKQEQSNHNHPAPNVFRDKKANLAWRRKDEDTASEPGASNRSKDETDAASAATEDKKPPRSRSLPRKRPPLRNSANPPSVKDDLRELQRQHNIDDSTVDDLEEILTGRKLAPSKTGGLLEQLPSSKAEDEIDRRLEAADDEVKQESAAGDAQEEASEGQSTLVEKMSRTVWSGLSNIREAKMGIERLEGHFAHAGQRLSSPEKQDTAKSARPHTHEKPLTHAKKQQQPCSARIAAADSEPVTVAHLHLPVPRLYQTSPHFRLTLLGLLLAVLSVWYAAESAMCARYCRPATCDSSTPCVYSYDDPTFGKALPVKVDQWTTGGHGRKAINWVQEELQDWVADIKDAVHGRSIQHVAVERLNAEERRQHWRRLRKRGLLKVTTQPMGPDQRAKWDSWRRSRLAKERAREAQDMGYDTGRGWAEADTIGGDERLW